MIQYFYNPPRRGHSQMKGAAFVFVVFVFSYGARVAVGQTTSTQILGTVTDPTGASVVGATVEVLRTATGEKRTVTTDASGGYILPSLEIGTYDVTVQAAGF